jgi:hypothetical protein
LSIGTLSTKTHNLIPEDELIGSLTRERVALMIRYAACEIASESGFQSGIRWLAYALDTDVPADAFMNVCLLADEAQGIEERDLMHWYDLANTDENREVMQEVADGTLAISVISLTNLLCAQLGVAA